MKRRDVLLAILAAGNGRSFTPAQIQKAAFLVSRNAAHLVNDGPSFEFVPYDYGPFDVTVYNEAENLERFGLAQIVPNGRWRVYGATAEGIGHGNAKLAQMDPNAQKYIRDVANWVLSLDFATLVKSIYEAYPEMKENSVFKG
jgi:hypothetical protein